jgi:DNA polymerase-2
MGEPVWSTLDYISKEELGYGKIEVESFTKMFDESPEKLAEYNLRDVELLNDLENEIGVLSNYLMIIWKNTGLDLADCLMPNSIGDILHLRHVHGKYVFPSKSPNKYIEYDGALVGGVIGLHNNVCVLDWNELYPTIMEMFHISVDTLTTIGGDIQLVEESNPSLNAGFFTDRIGWTVEIMKPFRVYRQIIKKKAKVSTDEKEKRKYKLISQAVKVVSNAQYGLYGQKTDKFTSRFYDPRIANAICLVGRILNIEARKIVEELGYVWVYYDTDSLFVKLKNVDGEIDFLKSSIEEKLRVFLKEKYNVTSLLRLDYEYTFSSMLVLAKKKYMGLPVGSNKPVVKGLRIIQKNTAKLTVIEEEKVGKMRMSGVSVKELKLYIYNMEHKVASGMVPLEDIIVKGRLSKKVYSKATAPLKAVIYAKEKLGIDIPVGQRFYWVYIIPKDTIEAMYDGKLKKYPAKIIAFTSIEQIRDNKDIIVDYKAMAKYTIRKPLAHYIEEAEKNVQSNLANFFSL